MIFSAACSSQRGCFTAILLAITVSCAACSRQTASASPSPASILQSIPAADAAKYPSLPEQQQKQKKDAKRWSNPYLVVRADRVGLLTGVDANEEQMLKPSEVLPALAQLPASAWPYGRAVAMLVDEKNAVSDQDKVSLRRNRGIVEGDLQAAHVAIFSIPAS